LRISKNRTFANDDIMNYIIGDLQQKLPQAPLPFNPALHIGHKVTLMDFLNLWKQKHCYRFIPASFHTVQNNVSYRYQQSLSHAKDV